MDGNSFCNGIDATTGRYLSSPKSPEELVAALLAAPPEPPPEKIPDEDASFEPMDGVDVGDLASTGWGVIFADTVSQEVREALAPLLERRRGQAGLDGYRKLSVASGTGKTPTAETFLRDLGAEVDAPVDPSEIPYYLLLVGDPDEISFEFQYQLDQYHAVGRICFETPQEYAAYAKAVIASEEKSRTRGRRAALFGVRNEGDEATKRSLKDLVNPLLGCLQRDLSDWEVETYLEQSASKTCLRRLLHEDPPAFLFTASHGLALPNGSPRQRVLQGALLCSEWEKKEGSVPSSVYFGPHDLDASADLTGLIAFCFACFSAATPGSDDFATLTDPWPAVAPKAFVSALAQRLLSQGALAVVGHVDRVWTHSFLHAATDRRETRVYEQTLLRILRGEPIGYALEPINRRHSAISARLADLMFRRRTGEPVPDAEIADAFLTRNDARNYVLLGDPAVRVGAG